MDSTPSADTTVDESTISDEMPTTETVELPKVDLDRVERDLNDVQAALERLNDGNYWTDEVTGESLSDEFMANNPMARTADSPR